MDTLLPDERHNSARTRIVEVAIRLIEEKGLTGFRIEALCQELGYTRQNLYRYFPGKRAILDAVIIESSKTMALLVAQQLGDLDGPFDEKLIEGVMIACDFIRDNPHRVSYSGRNQPLATALFMENAEGVQQALAAYLQPIYDEAKSRGELYLNMSYDDITKWLFHLVLSEVVSTPYESRESRKQFLLKMFSPSINAKKAQINATVHDVHSSHLR
ncbi:MAG: AcrR family transcriptional regulator [Halioglobus sp.]